MRNLVTQYKLGVVGWMVAVCLLIFIMDQVKLKSHRKLETSTPCYVQGLASIEQYRSYLHHNETKCDNMKQFGGNPPAPDNGKKFVCLDERFNIKPNDCLVFSFGINKEWSFENDMEKFGCRVYAYDPTMGKEDHQHSPKVTFFATGIANYKGVKRIGMAKKWADRKVDRFENLVNDVGEAGRPIDYIKLDVELSEIDFLQDMIFNSPHVLQNVKQIGMEIHDGNFKDDLGQITTFQVLWPYYMLLRCHGFKLIQTRPAWVWREVVWAREVEW